MHDNDWVVWIFVISCIIVVIFYDQHTNKRKQRIKVERHEQKTFKHSLSTKMV